MNTDALVLARKPIAPIAPRSDAGDRRVVGSTRNTGSLLIATINRIEGETGIHAHTHSLAEGMSRAKTNCEVIGPFSGSAAWLPIFAVRPLVLNRLNKTWSTRWHRYWHRRALECNLRTRLARQMPDAIIAQCPVSARAALNVRREMSLNIPIVAVCHFNHSEAAEYREKGELQSEAAYQAVIDLEGEVLRRVDKVIYVSQWARTMVEGDRGIRPRSSAVIWNGVARDEAVTPIDRSTLGLNAQDIVLINVGSLEGRKNQLGLLDQFARIGKAHPSAKLLLVGDGPDRNAIEKKINTLGLSDRVQCLGFRTDVPALLAAADLYVHYAKLENCPVVLLEAARAGLAAAAVPTGGSGEILQAIGAGVLLHETDLDRSVRSISRLMTEPDFRREMGQRARQGFLDRFTQDAMTRAYIEALRSVGASLGTAEAA
jgi:glycosyltransferase involved in cell wall biosynthesis